ncbi:bZIP transcription factor 53 [Musa acuminata AAA Group]|uniref:(wild Malaysian banana) hypothetical protein n=1 Tax=Musa acuminata subsp. malaccensis TaxID=214687 RepID=A0A804J9X3_MUSAM|nr:PREDICTED: bZIP transcription factor 53-like [Musa acuminata subsp. malaccensis]CAG1840388.1 unnamed protein product [Musa acuminata subsp. malaccensis]
MSPARSLQGSWSDGDARLTAEERKQRRKLSNRESARRSRIRKQRQLEDLTNQVAQLSKEKGRIVMQVDELAQHQLRLETENDMLRVRVAELTERLRSLSSVLRLVEELSGVAMDVPEIPDPLLKPWQPPGPALPVMAAAADMFQP